MEEKKKEYGIPANWDIVVTFLFFAAALVFVTIWLGPSKRYPLWAEIFFIGLTLFCCLIGGTSFHLTETGLTFRVFGIVAQRTTWEQVHLIRFIHPRTPREPPLGMRSSCLILYGDFPRFPQKYKTDWDGFLLLLFLLRHPRSVHSIQVPNKTRAEFLAAIKDLSRLPVEEILPGAQAPQKSQSPSLSGESGQQEPEKQPKQHKLLICLLFGFTGLNGLCFGLSQGDAAIRWIMIGAAALMALGIVLYCLVLFRQVYDRDLAIQGALVFALLSGLFLYLTFSWWFLAIVLTELAVLGIMLVLQRKR